MDKIKCNVETIEVDRGPGMPLDDIIENTWESVIQSIGEIVEKKQMRQVKK